ncbi:MAG TPA: AAA family ATPase, partial [Methylomirabilota bacterium]|nr:AAA family ATPase [Methylomirabilota bacterium]
ASARAALTTARDRAVADLAALSSAREQLAAALAGHQDELAEVEARLAEGRVALAARRSSLEALVALERAREGYGSGVRAMFAEHGQPRVAGIVGTVADLLDVPPDLERAVEAVLGERLEWIVVGRFEQARTAVAFLAEHSAGAATFLPLETLGDQSGEPRGTPPLSSSARWVVQQVAARAPRLLEYLLGDVAIVDHLDQAEALWRRNGVVATYVTPQGEVLTPMGRLRGGAGNGAAERSLLARKRQIRELEDEVRGIDAGVAAAQATAARLGDEVAALRARIAESEQALSIRRAERLAGEKDLEQAGREHERVVRHAETVRLEAGQVGRESDETAAMLTRLEQHIAAAREAEAAHETSMAALREAIDGAQQRETALVTELTACRVEVASVAERVEALGRETARIDQMEADLDDRLAQARTRRTQLADRRVWLAEERDRTDEAARQVAVARDRIDGDVRVAAERNEALVAELRAVEQDARELDGAVRTLVAGIHELELAATERRVRREELALEAARSFGVDETALRGRYDPARDLAAFRVRLLELEQRLTAIGPVNLVADEEYRELDERLTFLKTQHDDLTASIKDLDKALRGMTRTAQERFTHAFHEINREFSRIFERLFEGGRAELHLVVAEEDGDPLDTGVELMAQPRGKRLQSVTLLSGGERALTGLALLFAIFYYRPSPFCVLDEVDAPLDDANIHRFLRVLRELTSQTQFLVITHNRRTMEAADILYGVTMEEPGLSKLVSVKLGA